MMLKQKQTRRPTGRRLRWALIVLLIASVLDYWLDPTWVGEGGTVVNKGENGLWLRYTWYFGRQNRQDLVRLADRLDKHGIREAFFHVRGVDRSGRLVYHYLESAQGLNRDLAKLAPKVRRIAWIYAGNEQGHGRVDLSSAAVRHTMALEAAWLIRQAGFDGVQWDYEICPDQDADFLRLLEESRLVFPKGAYLGADV